MRRITSRWPVLLAAALAAGQARALPRTEGLSGPIWFYQAAPGLWRSGGAVHLTWAETEAGPTLTVRDEGRMLTIAYPGAAAHPIAGLCEGARAPLRWFSGRGSAPSFVVESGDCLRVNELWPGVALRLSSREGGLKADYIVEAGIDPSVIRVRYLEAREVHVEPHGGLVIETREGTWREDAPRAWLEDGTPADVKFAVRGDHTAGFEAQTPAGGRLIIDPAISYSGLFGGNGTAAATSAAIDAGGAVYVAGYTDAQDFPQSAAILARGGGVDGVVFKLEPSTGRLVWANYIGGSGDDRVHAIVIGSDGGVYAAGATSSTNFPLAGAASTPNRGASDAFVMKFTMDGSGLQFSTCLGGTGAETAYALAKAGAGVWVGGQTASTNFPSLGGQQSALRGPTDAFLARYSAGGALEFSSYLGGGGDEMIRAIAVTPSGDPVVGGLTGSADLALPIGAFQASLRGALDGFLLKLSGATGQVLAGTYLGGSGGTAGAPERVEALAVDGNENVYAAGFTPSGDFPTPNAWLGTLGGVRDGFLVKLNPNLGGVSWGTFLGGSGQEMIQAIALLDGGRVAAAGSTTSVNFPLQDPVVPAYRGAIDGFVTVFSADGASVPFSTYLGGSAADAVYALAAGPGNSVVAAGQSGSLDLPLKGLAAAPSGSALRVFVTRIALGALPQPVSVSPSSGNGARAVFELTLFHPGGATQIAGAELAFGDLLDRGPNCRVVWSSATARGWVAPEPGVSPAPVTLGLGGTSTGLTCSLSGSGSSATASGNTVTLRLDISFTRAFAGPRAMSVNATATDGAESGFGAAGAWTVPDSSNSPPSVTWALPSRPSGSSAVISVLASDADGGGDIARVRLKVGSTPTDAGACVAEYDRAAALFRLINDAGSAWFSAPAGSAVTLANSVCQFRVATTIVSAGATTLKVEFDVAFLPSMAGVREIRALVADAAGAQSAYALFGTFTVTASNNAVPVFLSLTPAAGSGSSQRFELAYSDSNGAADVTVMRVRINALPQNASGCVFELDRPNNAIRLRDDSGSAWLTAVAGAPGSVSNGQCSISSSTLAIVLDSSQIRLGFEATFKPAFNGAKTIWTDAEDAAGAAAGWTQSGSYIVAVVVAQPPVALSVSPSTGSGPSATFVVSASDPNGVLDVHIVRLLVNSQQSAAGGCYLLLNRLAGQVALASDTGASWEFAPTGSQTTLGNSQCSVNAAAAQIAVSGSLVLASFQITFKAAFNGAKSLWANATDAGGLTSASPWLGSYTVAVPVNLPPAPVSVTPSSGGGASQVFTVTWTDPNGGADILRGEVLISSIQAAAWGCYLQIRPNKGTVALASDQGNTWTEVPAGSASSVSNSQCTLRGTGSAIQVSGTGLAAMLDITFKPGFNGAKSIWANAMDTSNLMSSSPLMGSFTVAAAAQQAPAPVQAAPSAGSGGGQVFQFIWTDANGAEDIVWARVLIHSQQQAGGGCYFAIDRADNSALLADDAGVLRLKVRLGTSDAAANSQCVLQGSGSSVQVTGTTLSAYVDIRFKTPFNGLKMIWMNATDKAGLTSASPQVGTYEVFSNAPAAPSPAAVSPSSASGTRQTFTFTWTDPNGAQDVAFARVLIHSVQQAHLGCYIQIETASSRVLLANDAATGSVAANLGSGQTIENSQCRVHGAGSWLIASDKTLTAILDISFLPSFAGPKNIWMNATDYSGLTSASPFTGSFTVTP